MLVYCASESPRLTYILDELLKRRLGISWKCTNNEAYFLKTTSFRINYSTKVFPSCLNIPSEGLLNQEDILILEPEVKELASWGPVLFPFSWEIPHDTPQPTVCIPFDLFSACFFLVSRYEEYLPGAKRDEHGRFRADQSLAMRFNFLERPLIDEWMVLFRTKLLKQYPTIELKPNEFGQLNTIDIDFAYKFRGLSPKARIRKFLGALSRSDLKSLKKIISPSSENDPYDTYSFLLDAASKAGVPSYFFVLLSDSGGFDKNISPFSVELGALLKSLSSQASLGIHPSYKSGLNRKLLHAECAIFEKILGHLPTKSRQHFLKIKFPETPRNLIAQGIHEDYTLAYSEAVGFRASTAFPFFFFDLPANQATTLQLFSTAVMDVTLKNYMKLNRNQAGLKIQELKTKVETSGGLFVSIWHNSSFDPEEAWEGWSDVYKSLFY